MINSTHFWAGKIRYLLLVFACLSNSLICLSSNIRIVSTTYTYIVPDTKSLEEAKQISLERAKLQAIAQEFGTEISNVNTSIISTNNEFSTNQFFSFGENRIEGEWIETIGSPEYTINYDEGMLIVKCSVKGRIRNVQNKQIELTVKTLKNGISSKYASTEFVDGDDLYILFQSPANGYVSAYFHDQKNDSIIRIIPYSTQTIQWIPIDKGEEYVFFSTKKRGSIEFHDVDEISLTCKDDIELNTIYVIFSEQSISFNQNINSYHLDQFTKLLIKARENNPTLQIKVIPILIHSKP